MKATISARGSEWTINLPESLIPRAVAYALGVVAQRETAGMGEKDLKDDGTPYTEQDRLDAIRARFAKIQAGEWAESGGRAADPVMRELAAILRQAAVRKKAKTAYAATDVPGAAKPDALVAFAVDRFGKTNAEKLVRKAKTVADARAEADTF
jgi:hypothetical protein